MIVIRTAEELANAPPLHPTLQRRLQLHAERLAEYDIAELAQFAITEPHDCLDDLGCLFPCGVFCEGDSFSIEPELIETQPGWLELTFILSDHGFGVIMFIEQGSSIERQLASAIQRSLAGRNSIAFP